MMFQMLDQILLPELQRQYEALTDEEKMLSAEEKKHRHMAFVEHAQGIMKVVKQVSKAGLLELNDFVEEWEKVPRRTFDRDIIQMIVEAFDPDNYERTFLVKYFSAEKDTYQAIKHIISIYGWARMLEVNDPLDVKRLLRNMMPADVQSAMGNVSRYDSILAGEE